MSGYTKLFSDIVTSTIWQEPNDCRVLWITMLALKDRHNICRATVPSLAQLSGITIETAEQYLEKFQRPDKYSRSQEHEGRRIAPAEGGWLILNGEKYQDRLSAEDRREQVRQAVARHRAKKAEREAKRRAKGGTIRPEHVEGAKHPKITPAPKNDYHDPRALTYPPAPQE
jgi:hypothetical protein